MKDGWRKLKLTMVIPPDGSEDREQLMRMPFYTVLTGLPLPPLKAGGEPGSAIQTDEIEVVRRSFRRLAEAVRLYSADAHQFGSRPCHTCDEMTIALGEPFGCNALRLRRQTATK